MTDFQAKQIRELRLRGAGYKSIASAVGLSRDTVRNYCKSHGLDGYASALVLNVKDGKRNGVSLLWQGTEPAFHRKETEVLLRQMQEGMVVSPSRSYQAERDRFL